MLNGLTNRSLEVFLENCSEIVFLIDVTSTANAGLWDKIQSRKLLVQQFLSHPKGYQGRIT